MLNNFTDTREGLPVASTEPAADSAVIFSELSETVDVSRVEADLLHFVRTGELAPAPFALDADRRAALADGVSPAELETETRAYLHELACIVARLHQFIDALKPENGTRK